MKIDVDDYISNDEDLNIEDTHSYDKLMLTDSEKKAIFNKKIRLIICAVMLILSALSIIVFSSEELPKMMHKHTIEVTNADLNLVYIGESLDINITNRNNGRLEKLKTIFNTDNDYLFYILNKGQVGSSISTTIVPIQEGSSSIDVYSAKPNTKNVIKNALAEKRIGITVCPKFDISLFPFTTLSIVKGTNYKISADYGIDECSKDIIYKSNNEKIITVDETGLIKSLNEGSTELVVSKMGKTFNIPVVVTNSRIKPTSISTKDSKIQLIPGDIFRIDAKQLPDKSTLTDIKYTSSNPDVASVSKFGVIEASIPGTTIITIELGTMKKNIEVVVNDPGLKQDKATNIETDNMLINIKKGESKRIITKVTPDSAINRLNKWDSSDYDIVVVDYNGVIYGKKQGKAQITITNGKVEKKVDVIVTE